MSIPPKINIVRRPDARKKFGVGNTLFDSKVEDGLLPSPISLGARAVGWVEVELDAVAAAMIAGKGDQFIRELVKYLFDQRGSYLGAISLPEPSGLHSVNLEKVIAEKMSPEAGHAFK